MKIGPGVSELWGVENRPLPLTRPMAYTTACTTVQAWYAPRCSGLAGVSEWCWMERRTAQSCSSRFSRESGCMQASVLSPASVGGVCGGWHVRGNCMIALRLTRGYRKSGDDRQWRQELALNLPPASRHPRRKILQWYTHTEFNLSALDFLLNISMFRQHLT